MIKPPDQPHLISNDCVYMAIDIHEQTTRFGVMDRSGKAPIQEITFQSEKAEALQKIFDVTIELSRAKKNGQKINIVQFYKDNFCLLINSDFLVAVYKVQEIAVLVFQGTGRYQNVLIKKNSGAIFQFAAGVVSEKPGESFHLDRLPTDETYIPFWALESIFIKPKENKIILSSPLLPTHPYNLIQHDKDRFKDIRSKFINQASKSLYCLTDDPFRAVQLSSIKRIEHSPEGIIIEWNQGNDRFIRIDLQRHERWHIHKRLSEALKEYAESLAPTTEHVPTNAIFESPTAREIRRQKVNPSTAEHLATEDPFAPVTGSDPDPVTSQLG